MAYRDAGRTWTKILAKLVKGIKDNTIKLPDWEDSEDSEDSKPLTDQFKKMFLNKYGYNKDIVGEFIRKYGEPEEEAA